MAYHYRRLSDLLIEHINISLRPCNHMICIQCFDTAPAHNKGIGPHTDQNTYVTSWLHPNKVCPSKDCGAQLDRVVGISAPMNCPKAERVSLRDRYIPTQPITGYCSKDHILEVRPFESINKCENSQNSV